MGLEELIHPTQRSQRAVEVTASRRGLGVGEDGGRSLELIGHQVPLLWVSRLLLMLANHPDVPLTGEGVSLAVSE